MRGIVKKMLSLSNKLINLWCFLNDKHYLMEVKTPDQTDISHSTANPRRESDREVSQGFSRGTPNKQATTYVSFRLISAICV